MVHVYWFLLVVIPAVFGIVGWEKGYRDGKRARLSRREFDRLTRR